MRPATYNRINQEWSRWVGKVGEVVVATCIRVADEKHFLSAPYSFVLVDFNGQRQELMGVGHELISEGDKVRCVLRRNLSRDKVGLIEYRLKAMKID